MFLRFLFMSMCCFCIIFACPLSYMLEWGWDPLMCCCFPGHDGNVSYGGECFPKDSKALLSFMKDNTEYYRVLDSTVNERNKLRN